jgi:hypothetical protein
VRSNLFKLFSLISLINFSFNIGFICAQQGDTNCIKFSTSFKFTPGAYKSYDEFISNSPSYRGIFTIKESTKKDEHDDAYNKEYLEYYDSAVGRIKEIDSYAIWGYSDGIKVFKVYDGTFFLVKEIVRYTELLKTVTYIKESGYASYSPYTNFQNKKVFKTKNYSIFYDLNSDLTYSTPNLSEIEENIRNELNDYDINKSLHSLIIEYNRIYPICISKSNDHIEKTKFQDTNSTEPDFRF